MPYFEPLKLVYVAVPKTGSTSVIAALQQLLRREGGSLSLYHERVTPRYIRKHGLDPSDRTLPGQARHFSARQIRQVLGDRYEEAFSFSIVRNPWARAVSKFRFAHEDFRPPWWARLARRTRRSFHQRDFKEFLEGWEKRLRKQGHVQNQVDKLTDEEGRIIVDFIGRLESVGDDFAQVCRRLEMDPVPIPHANGTGGSSNYVSYYDDWSRELVAELYRRDIEAFGYAFGR